MKIVKLYIDENDIRTKLGEEYQNSNLLFINANIGVDNTLTF